jgi:hypothetical protein
VLNKTRLDRRKNGIGYSGHAMDAAGKKSSVYVASLRRKRLEVVGILIDYLDIAESLEVCLVTMG